MLATRSLLLLTALIGGAVATVSPAVAAEDRDWSGYDSEVYLSLYNSRTMTAFEGIVVSVARFQPAKGASPGVVLVVELATKERRTVHLGPEWFLRDHGLSFAKKDLVSITGSRATFRSKPVIIADEVSRGENTLRLRIQGGGPAWQNDLGPAG